MADRARVQQPRDRRWLSSHRQSASRPRGTCDCHPGGGARARRRALPDRRRLSSHRQSASWPRGTCDGHPGGARDPDRRRLSSHCQHVAATHHRRPVGSLPARTTGPGPRPGRTASASLPGPPLPAGQSAASPCDLWARARGRARTGSGRSPQSARRPTSVNPPHHRVSRAGRRAPADRQVWGTDSDTSRRRATAGPGRQHATRTLRARTTRHGDEAAASSSCRLPALVKVLQGCTPCTE